MDVRYGIWVCALTGWIQHKIFWIIQENSNLDPFQCSTTQLRPGTRKLIIKFFVLTVTRYN